MPSYSMAPDNGKVNRVSKLVVNPDTGPITCCWDDCWNRARTLWPLRTHEHHPRIPCDWVDQAGGMYGRHAWYTFCSEQCRRYWMLSSGWRAHETAARNNGRIYGMAAPGDKLGRYR